MDYKKIADTLIIRVDPGDDIVAAIKEACAKNEINLATVQGIGACDDVTIGVYLVEEQRYEQKNFQEEMEMTSLLGNITTMDGEQYVHLHANFGRADSSVVGGHLNRAIVSGTGEIFVSIIPEAIDRYVSSKTGLNVFDLD